MGTGSSTEKKALEVLQGRIMRCAAELLALQDNIWRLDMAKEINIRQVKMLNQGGQWLIVVTAHVQGVPVVKMKTISDIAQIGGVVNSMLTIEEWRPDKFAESKIVKKVM